jgi:hypothetical protein
MKAKFALILLGVCIISDRTAAFGQRLYPVQGPQAALSSSPALSVELTGSESGKISLALANGEVFHGQWSTAYAPSVSTKTPVAPTSDLPQPNMAFAWDAVYGQGYYVAKILGESIGHSVVTGNLGTILQVEFLNRRFGVAADNKGNIYKMVW